MPQTMKYHQERKTYAMRHDDIESVNLSSVKLWALNTDGDTLTAGCSAVEATW